MSTMLKADRLAYNLSIYSQKYPVSSYNYYTQSYNPSMPSNNFLSEWAVYFWYQRVQCSCTLLDLSSPSMVLSQQLFLEMRDLSSALYQSNLRVRRCILRSLSFRIWVSYLMSFWSLQLASFISYIAYSDLEISSFRASYFFCSRLKLFLSLANLPFSSSLRSTDPIWLSLFSSVVWKSSASSLSCLYLSMLRMFLMFLWKLKCQSGLGSGFWQRSRLRQSSCWLQTVRPEFSVTGLFLKVRNYWLVSQYLLPAACGLLCLSNFMDQLQPNPAQPHQTPKPNNNHTHGRCPVELG